MRETNYLVDDKDGLVYLDKENGVWVNADQGIWDSVTSGIYSADVHGKYTACGDPLCHAAMIFRECKTSFAGSTGRKSHFFSLDRGAHRDGCTAILSDYNPHKNSISFGAAIEEKAHIILGIGFDVGHAFYKKHGPAAKAERIRSPYNDLRTKYRHATLLAKGADEFERLVKRIERRDAEALRRTYVAHAQDVRRLSTVNIGSDKGKLAALFKNMLLEGAPHIRKEERRPLMEGGAAALLKAALEPKGKRPQYDFTIPGFPRYFRFSPTKPERREAYADVNEIRGTAVELERKGAAALVLLNILQLPDAHARWQIMQHGINNVLATPSLSTHEVRNALQEFKAYREGFIRMYWKVASMEQVEPVPGTKVYVPPWQRELNLPESGPAVAAG